jgi:hypothetical protein
MFTVDNKARIKGFSNISARVRKCNSLGVNAPMSKGSINAFWWFDTKRMALFFGIFSIPTR